MKNDPEDDSLLSFADLTNLVKKNSKRLWYSALIGACLAFFYALTRPVEYQVEASFKDKVKGPSEVNQSLAAIFLNGTTLDSDVLVLMKSRYLVEQIVKAHGLQAVIKKKERTFPFLPLTSIKQNLMAEYALLVNKNESVLDDEQSDLTAHSVVYQGESPLKLTVFFFADDQFEIMDKRKKIGKGKLGTLFAVDEFELALSSKKDAPSFANQMYTLTLHPLGTTAKKIAKNFKVEPDRNDKTLIKITYVSRNRHHSVSHVNALMQAYQEYTLNEHNRINTIQINYLHQRQSEMASQLEEMIKSYAQNLTSNLTSSGAATYEAAMSFLIDNQQTYMQKILALDLEMQWLYQAKKEGKENYDKFNSIMTPETINALSREIRTLKQNVDAIDLGLRNFPVDQKHIKEALGRQLNDLEDVKTFSEDISAILTSLAKNEIPESHFKIFDHKEFLVKTWYERLLEVENKEKIANPENSSAHGGEEWQMCRSNWICYLTQLLHYLNVRKRSIEEHLIHQHLPLSEFQGMDLETINELYIPYSKELTNLESKSSQHHFLINQINQPDFEISSLSTILNDPISTDMINQSSKLILSLKDHENRTQKEQERLKATLNLYKDFFITHLSQEVQLLELRRQLIKEKIRDLRSANLSMIQEKVSILENQIAEYITQRLSSLNTEKALYENRLLDFRKEMGSLPQKWVFEKLINQQLQINQEMVEEIFKLVESKNITNNLEIIQSKPLDFPITPLHPRHPHLLLYATAGAMLGTLLSLGWLIGKIWVAGVPASPDNLQLVGAHVSGILSGKYPSPLNSPFLDGDLSTLRRLIAFAATQIPQVSASVGHPSSSGKMLLLILGKGPHYTLSLAELMSKMRLKILVINLGFDIGDEQPNERGLLQYLEGTCLEPVILREKGYHLIPAGGVARYAHELLVSDQFKAFLAHYRTQYDWILAYSNALPLSVEADSLMSLFPVSVITIGGESLGEIREKILDVQQQERFCRLSFIFSQESFKYI